MSLPPADWYDDPEDPTQYRYWDGSQWSEHRAPKGVPAPPGARKEEVLGRAWSLLAAEWKPLLGLAGVVLSVSIVVLVIAVVAFDSALDPGLLDIIDRFSEPGFDPVNDPADEAFFDSIQFNPSSSFWIVLPLIILVAMVVQAIAYGAGMIHLAGALQGRGRGFSGSLSLTMRRLPRWLGVALLWMLGWAAVWGVAVLLIVAGVALPLLFLLIIPALIAFVVYVYPYVWVAPAVLIVGPVDKPPFRTAIGMVRHRWGKVALWVFLINLVSFGISIGLSLVGLIPILGVVINLLGQFVYYAFLLASGVTLYDFLDGEVAADIPAES